ncbi:MAG TPA: hypothetical protein VMF62_20910 [Acetobacteraceae bacterium]|nr:hypothetical protein [Acetobacteraceae bacterium]
MARDVPKEDAGAPPRPPPRPGAARDLQRVKSIASRALLVLLAIWAFGMIVPSFSRLFVPLASFGLSADNDGVITDVVAPFERAEESPAYRAGLAKGDRIDLQAMRCIPLGTERCASVLAVLGGLGGLQYVLQGGRIELVVRPLAGGPERTVHLAASPAPETYTQSLVLAADTVVGIAFVAAAFMLVWTRPSRMTWGFFLYAIWFNPGQIYTYYAILEQWPLAVVVEEVAEALAASAGLAGLLAFALRFPDNALDPRWRRLDRALPRLALGLAALNLISFANAIGFPTETLTRAMILFTYAIDAAVLAILLLRRRTLHPLDEQRMRWVIAGAAIGLPAFILAELLQSSALFDTLWGGSPSQEAVGLLYLVNGVLGYFVSTAVRKRRVISFAIPLRHGTILMVLTLALAVPIVYLHERLSYYQARLHLPEWIWPFVVAPIALLLLQRLHERAVELVDHVFNRGYHRARERLRHAAKAMLGAASPPEIDRMLVEECASALRLASAALFRRHGGDAGALVLVRTAHAVGWGGAAPRELSPERDGPPLRSLAAGRPLRLSRGAWERPGLPADEAAPCLAVPVACYADRAVAVALFGAHVTGTDISADESEALQEIASRAAEAYVRVETDLLRREIDALRARLAALGAMAG